MKTLILALAVLLSFVPRTHAELFSSSTNSVQTLTVASNEVIFISAVAASPLDLCKGIILQSNLNHEVPFIGRNTDLSIPRSSIQALAGPLQIQFQQTDVHIEFQRVALSNVFTRFVDATSDCVVSVPAEKTINFLRPLSWNYNGESAWRGLLTLSNNIVKVQTSIAGGESFTGPLLLAIRAGHQASSEYTNGLVTYFFTEEFTTIPAVGAIQVPAGQSQIQIEKSQDLLHWRTVFFNTVPDDNGGFYRMKAIK